MQIREITEHNVLTELYRRNGLEIYDGWIREMNPIRSIAVFDGDRLVGAATVCERLGVYVLDYIAVEKEYRKGGTGTELLNEIMKDIPKAYLSARAPLFFEKNGWKYTSEMQILLKDCEGCSQYKNGCEPKIMKRG